MISIVNSRLIANLSHLFKLPVLNVPVRDIFQVFNTDINMSGKMTGWMTVDRNAEMLVRDHHYWMRIVMMLVSKQTTKIIELVNCCVGEAMGVADAGTSGTCPLHFPYLCPLSCALFTAIQFTFNMSFQVFLSCVQMHCNRWPHMHAVLSQSITQLKK